MLSLQITTLIDKELKKYPADQRQSAVMAALRFVQDEKGWIAPEDMADVGAYLGMPQMAVYEVATFYHMYNLKPMGNHHRVHQPVVPLCGSGDTWLPPKKLGIGLGRTADGKFGLRASAWAPASMRRCSPSTTKKCAVV
jgi:NADH-quinone oxidoreductase subunit E